MDLARLHKTFSPPQKKVKVNEYIQIKQQHSVQLYKQISLGFVHVITIQTMWEVGVKFKASIFCLWIAPAPPTTPHPHSLNCHKGQLHNIKYHPSHPTVVPALEHLSEIDHKCRLDKLSAHPDSQMTHTNHAHTRTCTRTPESKHEVKGTHKRRRVVLRGCSGHRAWAERESECGEVVSEE